jgi:endonuclease YncB( thermonuclease family)
MLKPGKSYTLDYKRNAINVVDGDTLYFTLGDRRYLSRARWIDCPELRKPGQETDNELVLKHWEYAEVAKQFLEEIIKEDFLVVIPVAKDRYGRWLCDWFFNRKAIGTNIQEKIAKNGLCTYIADYNCYNCSEDELYIYLMVTKQACKAFSKRIGIWEIEDFIYPYKVRAMF